jgi:hypothetical protein
MRWPRSLVRRLRGAFLPDHSETCFEQIPSCRRGQMVENAKRSFVRGDENERDANPARGVDRR